MGNNVTKTKVEMHNQRAFLLDDGIYKFGKKGECIKIAEEIQMQYLEKDIDTGEEKAAFTFRNGVRSGKLKLPRNEYLSPMMLLGYQRIGLDIMPDTAQDIIAFLKQQEGEVELRKVHSQLGFSEHEGELIYKLYNTIGCDSVYNGGLDIKPSGSSEEYKQMLKDEVIGNERLEMILAIGATPVVMGYIEGLIDLDTLIVHLKSQSSVGKTTAIKLAISAFGNPTLKRQSLFMTYNATNNALIKRLDGIRSVPAAFDEISTSKIKNFTELIYNLCNGVDKERLNADAELKDKASWFTTILSTGERSLLKSANANNGLKVRVIEFNDFVWTDSAENSQNIKTCIKQHYGHLGMEFAKHIMSYDQEDILDKVKRNVKKITERATERQIIDEYSSRVFSNLSIILTALELLGEVLEQVLQVDKVLELLLDVEQEAMQKRSFTRSITDYISEYVSRYSSRFQFESDGTVPSTFWGKVTLKKDHVEVAILKEQFEQMVQAGGYEDAGVVLKELKQNGRISHEKDRNTRSRKTPLGITIDMYVIKLPTSSCKQKKVQSQD